MFNKRPGYIYIIKSEMGSCKIGRSKNVPDRLKLFEVKLPFNFEIIHLFPCCDMVDAERQLHLIFGEKRVNGEWFELSNSDIAIIKTVHCANDFREFCKMDGHGNLWGMPELWKYIPSNYYVKYS